MSLTTTYGTVFTRSAPLTNDPTMRVDPDAVLTADGGLAMVSERVATGDLEVRFSFASSPEVTVVLADQSNASITRLTGGDYIVVAEAGDNVVLTWFSAAGVQQFSSPLSITEYRDPSVAALNNGGFVVVGTDAIGGGFASSIVARFYGANGSVVRQVTIDPPLTIGLQSSADVTVLNNGNVVFVWSEPLSNGQRQTEYAIYNSSGQQVRAASVFNTASVSGQDPTVVALPDGGFLVASESAGASGTTVARYSATGVRQDIATIPGPFGGVVSPQLNIRDDGVITLVVKRPGEYGGSVIHTLSAQLDVLETRFGIYGDGDHATVTLPNSTVALLNSYSQDILRHDLTLERRVTGDNAADVWNGDHVRSVVDGGGGNDRLYGGSGTEFLIGGAGDDILSGGDGDDVLTGGLGADILIGGAGSDRADYGQSTAGVMIDLNTGRGYGGHAAGDILAGIESVWGSAYNDVLYGAETGVSLHGWGGNDMLFGGEGRDFLNGDAGDDIMRGGFGNDKLDGGVGFDTVDYGGAVAGIDVDLGLGVAEDGEDGVDTLISIERVFGSRFNDVIVGHSANESLYGGLGNDRIEGGAGDDLLSGGDGDDALSGGQGADVLDGGAGRDVAVYSGASAGVTVRLHLGTASDGEGATDTLISIEDVVGSAFNDVIIGDDADNELSTGGGSDTLVGGGGNDILRGGVGASTLQGGVGDDRYVIMNASDTIVEFAGEGIDTVATHLGTLTLGDNVENGQFIGIGGFVATGNGLNNILTGGFGDDVLRGRGGNDTLNGGDGNDTADYSLAAAGVTARLDQQRATNDGDGGVDTFTSIEALIGSAFVDLLIGGTGADRLDGGLGADTLLGGAGDDVLIGGSGAANTLQGGTGNDHYVVDVNDTIVELAGEGTDFVEVRRNEYSLAANVENMTFTGTGAFTGTGNASNNVITGGDGNDVLRGMGGSDTLMGGAGTDEVQFRGSSTEYEISVFGLNYRVQDTVAGRDGVTILNRVELARFLADGALVSLPIIDQNPGQPGVQAAPTAWDAEEPPVRPALDDDAFLDLKGGLDMEPLVRPGLAEPLFRPTHLSGGEPARWFEGDAWSAFSLLGDWSVEAQAHGLTHRHATPGWEADALL